MFMGRKSISAVLAASLSLSAAPSVMAASAAHRVAAAQVTLDTGSANGHHRWRHRDRISGDDIIRGIGIVTGILILADVAGRTAERAERRAEERQRNDDRAEDGPVFRLGQSRDGQTPHPRRRGGCGRPRGGGEKRAACL